MIGRLIAIAVCSALVGGCVTRTDTNDRHNDPIRTSCDRPCFEGNFERNDPLRNDPLR